MQISCGGVEQKRSENVATNRDPIAFSYFRVSNNYREEYILYMKLRCQLKKTIQK